MKSVTSRPRHLTAVIATLSASLLCSVSATSASASEALQVESSALRSAQLNRQVMRDYGGHYRLDDGSVLSFSREGARVFATIATDARERRVEVKAVTANRFVAIGDSTEFRFESTGNDRVTVSRAVGTQLAQAAAAQPAS